LNGLAAGQRRNWRIDQNRSQARSGMAVMPIVAAKRAAKGSAVSLSPEKDSRPALSRPSFLRIITLWVMTFRRRSRRRPERVLARNALPVFRLIMLLAVSACQRWV